MQDIKVEFSKDSYAPGETLVAHILMPALLVDWVVVQVFGVMIIDQSLTDAKTLGLSVLSHAQSLSDVKGARQYLPVQHRLPENSGLLYVTSPEILTSGQVDKKLIFFKKIPCMLLPSFSGFRCRISYGLSIGWMLPRKGSEWVNFPFLVSAAPDGLFLPHIAVSEFHLEDAEYHTVAERQEIYERATNIGAIRVDQHDLRVFNLSSDGTLTILSIEIRESEWMSETHLVCSPGKSVWIGLKFRTFDQPSEQCLEVRGSLMREEEGPGKSVYHSQVLWQDVLQCDHMIEGALEMFVPAGSQESFESGVLSHHYRLAIEVVTAAGVLHWKCPVAVLRPEVETVLEGTRFTDAEYRAIFGQKGVDDSVLLG